MNTNVIYGDLAGKVAVVTGANGGIGRAIVEQLLASGTTVIATGLDITSMQPGYVASTGTLDLRVLDVTNTDQIRDLADAIAAKYGAIDIWINNAGTLAREPALTIEPDAWQHTFDVNLKGTFFGAQAACRHMAKQGSGSIINLSSYAGIKARPNCADYAAAKAGVAHMTECLALEWGPLGVRVNAIAPGYIDTPMSSWMHADANVSKTYLERTPIRRIGTPQEIAASALFLASSASSYVTGHVLVVDGGISKA
ncbi:MAG: SDR family oxidoreductase [Burkholderiaceae bacterium]|nr:SDR family oxidoreductase [Burkholderiaceae bacterium]